MKFLKMTKQQKNKILYHHVLLSSKKTSTHAFMSKEDL